MEKQIKDNQLHLPYGMKEQEATDKVKYVGFMIGDNEYCVPVEALHEIIPFREITPLPQAPEGIIGIIDWRGKMINVIDIYRILGITKNAEPSRDRILITKFPKTTAIIVETTTILMDINEGECHLPGDDENIAVNYLYERNDKIIKLLDTNILLNAFNKTEEDTPGGEHAQ
jgi:purine-binding chemotaxis protein CheW